jgi:CubicO group peptidase (beta-lactamase class C family)
MEFGTASAFSLKVCINLTQRICCSKLNFVGFVLLVSMTGWVTFTTTPTPGSSGAYGAHWWLNMLGSGEFKPSWLRAVPHGAFFASGHEGQLVVVIPSHSLVVVRLGLTFDDTVWNPLQLFTELMKLIPETQVQ